MCPLNKDSIAIVLILALQHLLYLNYIYKSEKCKSNWDNWVPTGVFWGPYMGDISISNIGCH